MATIGIDLGTTNSCMAVMRGGRPIIIENAEGSPTTPSVVAFGKCGERLVGISAKDQAVTNASQTVTSITRLMGRKVDEVRDEPSIAPYRLLSGPRDDVRIDVGGKQFRPPEISAMILAKLKADAEAYLGETVDGAVITVPAYFNDDQRQATKDAGKIAGLDVKRIVNGPTAASLAYGFDKEIDETILVFDLGGGTFDVSVLEIGDGVFEVKSTAGDNYLGGDDWDEAIVDWLASEFKRDQGVDLTQDPMALQRLHEAAEQAKVSLSTAYTFEIRLPGICAAPALDLETRLTRQQFNDLTAHLVERVVAPVRQALADAREKLRPEERDDFAIDHVVLVGGMTRMPAVKEKVKELTALSPTLMPRMHEQAAIGAALVAGTLTGLVKDVLLLDVTPLTLGIETKGGVMTKLIERNTTIPTRKGEVFSTAEDNQPSVEIHVLQGEREMATYNKSLGKFQLTGIPPAPRGIPQIEVTFDIDANGILAVWAKDLGTGKEQHVEIHGGAALSDAEVRRASEHLDVWALDSPIASLDVETIQEEEEEALPPPARPAAAHHSPGPLTLFYSYSHVDEKYRDELELHLTLLRRQRIFEGWHDGMLQPGQPWRGEITSRLESADLILLLVSPNFLASDFCWETEMAMALDRHGRGEAHVIPIIIRHVDWANSPLGELQVLPKDGLPVSAWPNRDEAWHNVASALRTLAIEERRKRTG